MATGAVVAERPTGRGAAGGEARPLYCARCANPRPLGLVSPGRFWSRWAGRTILASGGTVTVWCGKCGKQHDLDLGDAA